MMDEYAFAKMMATAPPANPYTPGVRVSDVQMFFGREAELRRVQDDLRTGVHVAVIGPGSIGCSSLLWRAADMLSQDGRARILTAFVDMKDNANQTLIGLLGNVWEAWWNQVSAGQVAPVENPAEFVTAVRKLHAAGFRPVLLLDAFEQLAWRSREFDDSLLETWLELGREGALTFAVTAQANPADLLAQNGFRSRFYELFQPLDLGLLDELAALALLTVPAVRAGLGLPDGAVERLVVFTGPHPFFLQLAGRYLFDSLLSRNYSSHEVAAAFTAVAEPYWQAMWEQLSPLAQQYFPLTPVTDRSGMEARQLSVLAGKGLVIEGEAGWRPFSEGFASWLARQRTAEQMAAMVAATRNSA